jgi:hypothetical protein
VKNLLSTGSGTYRCESELVVLKKKDVAGLLAAPFGINENDTYPAPIVLNYGQRDI